MDNYYDQIAEGYEELHKKEQIKKVNLIKKNFKVRKDDLLLDVGCGTGLTTRDWDCKKIGIDSSIRLLKRASGAFFMNAEAENIPFKDKTFDVVISITAIQNFKDIKKALREIKRVGKNRFVLSFLKKSAKKDFIMNEIKNLFKIKNTIEEEKDLIFIVE